MSIANLFTDEVKSYQNIKVNSVEGDQMKANSILITDDSATAKLEIQKYASNAISNEYGQFVFSIISGSSETDWTAGSQVIANQGNDYTGTITTSGNIIVELVDVDGLYLISVIVKNQNTINNPTPDDVYKLFLDNITTSIIVMESNSTLGVTQTAGAFRMGFSVLIKPVVANTQLVLKMQQMQGASANEVFDGEMIFSRIK